MTTATLRTLFPIYTGGAGTAADASLLIGMGDGVEDETEGGTEGLSPDKVFSTSPAEPPEDGQGASNDDLIVFTVRAYIEGLLRTPEVHVANKLIFKRDPDIIRLIRYLKTDRNFALLEDIIVSERDMHVAAQAAIDVSDSYEAGLAMGVMGHNADIQMGSERFQEGYRIGQAYHIKFEDTAFENKFFKGGALLSISGMAFLYKVMEYPDFIPQKVIDLTSLSAKLSLVYGFGTMLITGLFGSDRAASKRLITSGPFHLHRNPYYASLGFTITSTGGLMVFSDLASGTPHYLLSLAIIGGITSFLGAAHQKVLRDERVLEKAFGDLYRRYKASTPRYLPAIWKIFSIF